MSGLEELKLNRRCCIRNERTCAFGQPIFVCCLPLHLCNLIYPVVDNWLILCVISGDLASNSGRIIHTFVQCSEAYFVYPVSIWMFVWNLVILGRTILQLQESLTLWGPTMNDNGSYGIQGRRKQHCGVSPKAIVTCEILACNYFRFCAGFFFSCKSIFSYTYDLPAILTERCKNCMEFELHI